MNKVMEAGMEACRVKWEAVAGMTTEELLTEMRTQAIAATTAELLMPKLTRELLKRGVIKTEMTEAEMEAVIDQTLDVGTKPTTPLGGGYEVVQTATELKTTDTSGDHQAAMFRGGEGGKH